MRTCVLSLVCLLLFESTAAADPSRIEVLRHIDAAWQAGEITWGERLIRRVQAVKAPHELPDRWWRMVRDDDPPARGRMTSVLVEAFQERRWLAESLQLELTRLLLPPDDLQYSIDSTDLYPIRVSYATPGQAAEARIVMDAAVTSYQKEVVEWGFWAPPIEPGAGLYRIYLDNAGGAAGYTSPYMDNSATPHTDSFSYIVIDHNLSRESMRTTVAHEFNHACQLAMDAYEVRAFLENTATYIETMVYPEDWYMTEIALPYFQSQPHRALDYMNLGDSDLYEYGGALWVLFLEATYGDSDPRWIRRVWEASVQTAEVNEPDYLDALDDILQDQGGLAGAVQAFARARFFVGDDGDGQHIPGAEHWEGSEVSRIRTVSTRNLPLADRIPVPADVRPQPNGCNYLVLNVTLIPDFPVRFSFDGSGTMDWSVQVLQIAAGQDATHVTMEVDAQGKGQLSLDVTELDQAVMVVCQLGDDEYDPDQQAWYGGEYTWSMGLEIPPPTVTSITPDRLAPGTHGTEAIIRGTGFAEGDGLAIRAYGEHISITLEEFVSDQELRVKVFVLPDAELGPRDIIITNPGGNEGTGVDLLNIVEEEPEPEPGSGCSCQTRGSGTPALPFILFLLMLAALRQRSRRHQGVDHE